MTIDNNECEDQEAPHSRSDAHGRAALLLVESLIHGLCETAMLSAGQAVEIAERAVDVQFDQAEATKSESAQMWRSHTLLSSIATSLRTDDRDGPPRPYLVS